MENNLNQEPKNEEPASQDNQDLRDLHSKIYAHPEPDVSFLATEPGGKDIPSAEAKTLKEQHPHLHLENKLKLWLVGFFSIFALLLIIAGISLYQGDVYWIRDLLGFGLPKDPVKAVEKVSQNMSKVKSYKSDLGANLTLEADNEKITGSLTGSENTDKSKNESSLELSIKDLNLPESSSTDQLKPFLKDLKEKGKVSLITTEKEVYFKTDFLEGKWHRIDLNTYLNPAKTSESEKGFSGMAAAAILGDTAGKTGFEEMGKYIKSAEKLKDEKIKRENVYHYLLKLDLVKAIDEDEEFKSIPDFQKEMVKTFVNKYIDIKMDFYVSKKNLLLSKQSVGLDIKVNMADFGSSGIFKFKFSLEGNFKDIDKPVSIEKPQDYTDFDQKTLKDLLGPAAGQGLCEGANCTSLGSQEKIRDSRRKGDLRQIQTALEQYADDNNGNYPAITDDSKDGVFLQVLTPNYLAKTPVDPSHPTYYYKYVSDGKTYTLTCILENKNDKDGQLSGNYNTYILKNP